MVSKFHRRSLFEILYEILEAINKHGSIKYTWLLYAVNISSRPLSDCLTSLESLGLVEWIKLTSSKKGEVTLTIKGQNAYKGITKYVALLYQVRDKMPD